MTAVYDWTVQTLVAAPLAVQLVVLLAVALPLCAVAAVVQLRLVDLVAVGFRCRTGADGGRERH